MFNARFNSSSFALIYIIFSWWCWWYGGSYSSRPMIDIYGILAISLAVFLFWLSKQKFVVRTVLYTILSLMIILGVFQTTQYRYEVIHWDSMSKKAYWDRFGKLGFPDNFNEILEHPDYEKAKQGVQRVLTYDEIPDYKFHIKKSNTNKTEHKK